MGGDEVAKGTRFRLGTTLGRLEQTLKGVKPQYCPFSKKSCNRPREFLLHELYWFKPCATTGYRSRETPHPPGSRSPLRFAWQ